MTPRKRCRTSRGTCSDTPSRCGEPPGFCRPGESPPAPPPPGLSIGCRVRTVITGDHLIVDLDGGCEIDLFLIGVDAPPAGDPTETGFRLNEAARDFREGVAALIRRYPGHPHAFIPQPRFDRGWVRTIAPRSKHAGLLFLPDAPASLNELVRLRTSTDRECASTKPSRCRGKQSASRRLNRAA